MAETALTKMAKNGLPVWQQFRDDEVMRPMEVTTKFLLDFLEENKDTEFGKKHNFKDIKTIEDYQKNVPVTSYDDYSEYIERMVKGEKGLIISELVEHFNTTSGTLGNPKKIPLSNKQTALFSKYNRMLNDGLLYDKIGLDWTFGRAFATTEGNAEEVGNGITVGCASSRMAKYIEGGAQGLDAMMRTMFTSPVEAMMPGKNNDTKYLHTRFALMDEGLTGIITGFFSCLSLLLRYIEDNWEMLVSDIENGTINEDVQLTDEYRESLLKKIQPMPERAKQLREVFSKGFDEPFMPKVWPKLTYLQGVGGDGFSVFDNIIKERYMGYNVHTMYSGITASEGLWTVPFDLERTDSVIAPGAAFLEFLPVDAENDFSKIVTLDKLEEGKIYEIIATTASGLYRYRMSDAVKVTGKFGNTPTVEFMFRVNKTVNLVCEKTTEDALTQAVMKTSERLNMPVVDYTLIANPETRMPRYEFYIEFTDLPQKEQIEIIRDTLEEELGKANPRYTANRKNMLPLHFAVLQPETYLLYRDVMVTKGTSPSQLKPVHVAGNVFQTKFFSKLVEEIM